MLHRCISVTFTPAQSLHRDLILIDLRDCTSQGAYDARFELPNHGFRSLLTLTETQAIPNGPVRVQGMLSTY
jgi:hypothetical protein